MGESNRPPTRKKILQNLKRGQVIRYSSGDSRYDTYLIVSHVEDGKVSGQMGTTHGVNSITIDNLLKKEDLSLASFDEI